MVGGYQPFGRFGGFLDDVVSHSPVIRSEQLTNAIDKRGHGDWNISLSTLESCPEVQRGGIGHSGNEGIGINTPETIRCN